MIDLHCHILPGIDDGSKNKEEALALAKQAVAEGIDHLLCTPHHHNGVYLNPKNTVIQQVADFQQILAEENIPLTLYEGQEVRIHGELLDHIAQGDILFADLTDRYVLIEFPDLEVPTYAIKLLFTLCSHGIIPIIVHPERHPVWIKDPNELLPFIEMGCLAQVTAASYVGFFGKKVQKTAEVMLEHNMVHVMASDAHHITKRPFLMKESFQKLEKEMGSDTSQLFQERAKHILNGDRFQVPPALLYEKPGFKLFRN